MSLCICLQNNDGLMIAADTALTINAGGRSYRSRQPYQKLVQIENFLLFMSGNAEAARMVLKGFLRMPVKDVNTFRSALVDGCNQFTREYPDIYNTLDSFTRDVGALLAELTPTGVLVHTMQPKDNFELHTHQATPANTIPHTVGINANEAQQLMEPWLKQVQKTKPMGQCVKEVFEALAGGNIGGTMTVAMMNKEGITFLPPQIINEKVSFPYFEDQFEPYGSIYTGSLIGCQISTGEAGIFPRAEMSNTDKTFSVWSTPDKGIEIRSWGENGAPNFRFVNGSDYATVSLPNSEAGLYMNGNRDLTLEFMNINLRGYDSIRVIDWSRVKNEQTGVSLLSELEDKAKVTEAAFNMTFDEATRNLKLWSKTGNLLAQVPIPK
ncbi:hypothetical protein [Paenibacillus aquistagni]|uniref:Uncharacterized protein n=1 Tax=Paenibacillus aquistagni TaxID=1852522 RepID=A0A1X7LRH5_9BACL|nr:hypothetical protein [Paenibacillus aquistagni]SMG56478.1 hypothetical protein SAMN06295960_4140 [Paenibacillus aquistagni]